MCEVFAEKLTFYLLCHYIRHALELLSSESGYHMCARDAIATV